MRQNSKPYDFAGWVTKNDIRCTDGVTIRHGAFSANDGAQVPLVWKHQHGELENIIGNVDLEERPQGVWGKGRFNTNEKGRIAKELVKHGDIYAMSIGANRIKRSPTNDVIGGNIYEVSLVVSGANPGATIQEVLAHSDGQEGSIIFMANQQIHTGGDYNAYERPTFLQRIQHSDENGVVDAIDDVLNDLTEDQQQAVAMLVEASSEEAAEAAAQAALQGVTNSDDDDMEFFEDEDGNVFYLDEDGEPIYIDPGEEEDGDIQQSDLLLGGQQSMHYNVFDNTLQHQADLAESTELIHSDLNDAIVSAANQGTTLSAVLGKMAEDGDPRASVLQHSMNNVDVLFPDHQLVGGVQVRYSTNTATEHILGAVTKAPTAFVKSIESDLSDLSNEELRAKGYIKGTEKKEQIVAFTTRKTDPKTIYKKQSIDRDDAIDMSKMLNVATFFYQEMRTKLNDEIARAILVGDGRQTGNPDKIDETKIRPIATDSDYFTIKEEYDGNQLLDIFETVAQAKTRLQGSGMPSLYVNPTFVTKLRFLRNKNDQWVFGGQQPATKEYLAALFGVKEIIETNFLTGGKMIMVNLADYQIGTDKGGEVNTFEKFDIDFNKQKYLIETRISGALVKGLSAVAFTPKQGTYVEPTPKAVTKPASSVTSGQ